MARAEDRRVAAIKRNLRDASIRTFEMVQYISGYIEDVEKMEDLPSHIQDAVMEALENKSDEVGLPLTIVYVHCDKDIDSEDPQRQFFLHIIASEIVAAVIPTGPVH